mmetsp:Transcript_4068/g.4699  ORF Transcript_4068/g.4699 Transcript_4068/m.4699 type:complete len:143 (-) Transcript_4068:3-431(-)
MSDFNYKHNSLIKFKSEDSTHGIRSHMIQFHGLTGEVAYKWVYNGTQVTTKVYGKRQFDLKQYMAPPVVIDYGRVIMAPMPGAIVNICVEVGDTIEDGQDLLTMEAMKMQNLIKSERCGVIKAINIKEGDAVAVDAVLIEFE